MIISIVGCGPSANDWNKVHCDLSIGVNDCVKFGHQVDWLVVINVPRKFEPSEKNGMTDRLKTIIESKPKRFFAHDSRYKEWFPNYELLAMREFMGTLRPGRIMHSKTSPFVAIGLAYEYEKPTDIILWGIDFLDHPNFSGKILSGELDRYRILFECLEEKGVRCWIGNEQTALAKYLKVWKG